jgi:hypothetical protein
VALACPLELLLETLIDQLVPRFRDHVQGVIHELLGVVRAILRSVTDP